EERSAKVRKERIRNERKIYQLGERLRGNIHLPDQVSATVRDIKRIPDRNQVVRIGMLHVLRAAIQRGGYIVWKINNHPNGDRIAVTVRQGHSLSIGERLLVV